MQNLRARAPACVRIPIRVSSIQRQNEVHKHGRAHEFIAEIIGMIVWPITSGNCQTHVHLIGCVRAVAMAIVWPITSAAGN